MELDSDEAHSSAKRRRMKGHASQSSALKPARKLFPDSDSSTDESTKQANQSGAIRKGKQPRPLGSNRPPAAAGRAATKKRGASSSTDESEDGLVEIEIKTTTADFSDDLKCSCVSLITRGGNPLSLMDSALTLLINPMLDAIPEHERFTVSSKAFAGVHREYKKAMAELKNELKGRAISLTIIPYKSHGRCYLDINVELLSRDKSYVRSLAESSQINRGCGLIPRAVIADLLKDFRVLLGQVYSITIDSWSILAAILKDTEKTHVTPIGKLGDVTAFDLEDFIFSIRDSISGDIIAVVPSIPLVLKLALTDFLSHHRVLEIIGKARQAAIKHQVKYLITPETEAWEVLVSLQRRWDEGEADTIPDLTKEEWTQILELVLVIRPLKFAINYLEAQKMFMGEALCEWVRCKRRLEKLESEFARELLECVEAREQRPTLRTDWHPLEESRPEPFRDIHLRYRGRMVPPLFENPPVAASIYLDPRYRKLLSPGGVEVAEKTLRSLFKRLGVETPVSLEEDESEDEVEAYLKEKEREDSASTQGANRSTEDSAVEDKAIPGVNLTEGEEVDPAVLAKVADLKVEELKKTGHIPGANLMEEEGDVQMKPVEGVYSSESKVEVKVEPTLGACLAGNDQDMKDVRSREPNLKDEDQKVEVKPGTILKKEDLDAKSDPAVGVNQTKEDHRVVVEPHRDFILKKEDLEVKIDPSEDANQMKDGQPVEIKTNQGVIFKDKDFEVKSEPIKGANQMKDEQQLEVKPNQSTILKENDLKVKSEPIKRANQMVLDQENEVKPKQDTLLKEKDFEVKTGPTEGANQCDQQVEVKPKQSTILQENDSKVKSDATSDDPTKTALDDFNLELLDYKNNARRVKRKEDIPLLTWWNTEGIQWPLLRRLAPIVHAAPLSQEVARRAKDDD